MGCEQRRTKAESRKQKLGKQKSFQVSAFIPHPLYLLFWICFLGADRPC
jgi:hypothetical protein